VSRRQHRHRTADGGGRGLERPDAEESSEPTAAGSIPRRDRRSSRWDAHRRARRAELTVATVAAIRAHGADVGMSQVAAQARTSKTVVYRHFADKYDLYLAVCERVAAVLVRQLQKAMRDTEGERTLYAGIDAYLGLIEADPEVYRYVMRPPRLDRPVGRHGSNPVSDLTTLIGDQVGQVITTELRRRGRDVAPAITWGHALVGMIRAAADQWRAARPDAARATLAQQLAELAWDGLSRPAGRSVASA